MEPKPDTSHVIKSGFEIVGVDAIRNLEPNKLAIVYDSTEFLPASGVDRVQITTHIRGLGDRALVAAANIILNSAYEEAWDISKFMAKLEEYVFPEDEDLDDSVESRFTWPFKVNKTGIDNIWFLEDQENGTRLALVAYEDFPLIGLINDLYIYLPGKTLKIAPQFEYNTYIRDFMANNKDKSLAQAIKCWKYKKSFKGSNKYEAKDLKAL